MSGKFRGYDFAVVAAEPSISLAAEVMSQSEPVASTSRTTPPPTQSAQPSQSVAPSSKRPRDEAAEQESADAAETPVKRTRLAEQSIETQATQQEVTPVQLEASEEQQVWMGKNIA